MTAIIIILQVLIIATLGYCLYLSKKLDDIHNELLTNIEEIIKDIEDEVKVIHEATLKKL
jgi:Tfp pilus assembly protein PilO